LNRLDITKPIYVTEGPFDAMFLNNGIASMDSNLLSVIPVIGLDCDYVFCYDCENRSVPIVKMMRNTIAQGHKICIWPQYWHYKDINEAVMDGFIPAAIRDIIDRNTYSGLIAELKLNEWEKTK